MRKFFTNFTKKRFLQYSGFFLTTLFLLILLSNIVIFFKGRGHASISIEELKTREVVIVPGARVWPDGTPSKVLRDRLDGAAELYFAEKTSHILVSGDNRESHYDESTAMGIYLQEKGIPARDITLDYAGFDTWDTCIRANQQFGVSAAIFVTQDRYVKRSASLCESAGIDIQILELQNPPELVGMKIRAATRERLAVVKAFGDILRKPSAYHQGEFIGLPGSDALPS